MRTPTIIQVSETGVHTAITRTMVYYSTSMPASAKLAILLGQVDKIVVINGHHATLYVYHSRVPYNPEIFKYLAETGVDKVIYLRHLT